MTTTKPLYEEWIGYPDRRDYVPLDKHDTMSCRQGWWASGWRGEHPPLYRRNLTTPAEEPPQE